MSQTEVFDFPSFYGEHPYMGILLVPWNYSPCILVATSWCLSHTTSITRQYFGNISMKNPYKVITGLISTSQQDANKNQIALGIQAVFHPNPLVEFVLIKVIPEFRFTLFVDHRQLKYNANETVNENCESVYWFLNKRKVNEKYYFYEYILMNQVPCPYERCHCSNMNVCSIFNKPKTNDVSATILCDNHAMSFAEFGYEDGRSVRYHRITDDVIMWMKQYIYLL